MLEKLMSKLMSSLIAATVAKKHSTKAEEKKANGATPAMPAEPAKK